MSVEKEETIDIKETDSFAAQASVNCTVQTSRGDFIVVLTDKGVDIRSHAAPCAPLASYGRQAMFGALSRDETCLYFFDFSTDRIVCLDLALRKERAVSEQRTPLVKAVAVLDNALLVSASYGDVSFMDLVSLKTVKREELSVCDHLLDLKVVTRHSGRCNGFIDTNLIITGGGRMCCLGVDLELKWRRSDGFSSNVATSPGQCIVVVAGGNGKMEVLSVRDGAVLCSFSAGTKFIKSVHLLVPRIVLIIDSANEASLWRLDGTPATQQNLKNCGSVSLSPCRTRLVASEWDETALTVRIFDVKKVSL